MSARMESSPEPEDVITVEDEHPCDRWKVHCVATWKIRNFGCCQLECGEELFSPLLSADSSGKIKWYLSIFPNGQANFEECISIHVIFIRSAETPVDTFRASCRVSILDCESKAWITDRIDQNLSRFQFNTFVKKEQLFQEKNKIISQDTLTIRCQISAFDVPKATELEIESGEAVPPYNDHLKTFVDDFKRLYDSGKFSDVILESKDGNISAHKVILAARSSVFAQLFREPHATYPITDFDKDTINTLMSYIYSGRVDPAVPALSLDLHELAQTYKLRELTSALAPNQISVETEVTNEVFTYTWHLKNFSSINIETQRIRYSEKFHTGPSSRAWSLSLGFKRTPNDDSDQYLAIYVNKLWTTGDEKAIYIRLSVSLLDREQQPRNTVEAEKLYKLSGRHGFPNFIKRSNLLQQREDLLPSDTLTIHCSMRICDGASASKVKHSFHSRGSAAVSDAENLSVCLGEMLHKERFSDVTVCATDREFRLHKPVLCARSTVFADFFDRYSNGLSNYTINIQGIRAEILELLFAFVYTGEFKGAPTYQTAPGLFAAADHYKILGLKKICSDFMKSNASEVLVAVNQTADTKMRELVKDFVCSNAEDVLVSDQWPELVQNHPRLASDVIRSLARGYREAKRRRLE